MPGPRKPKSPLADRTPLGDYVARCINALGGARTQQQIAMEAGFKRANVISMIKTGEMIVPLERVAPLAKAIEGNQQLMMRLVLRQQGIPEEVFWSKDQRALLDLAIAEGLFDEPLTEEDLKTLRVVFHGIACRRKKAA